MKNGLGAQRWQAGNTELADLLWKTGSLSCDCRKFILNFWRWIGNDFMWTVVCGKLFYSGRNVKNGEYFLWLPGGKTSESGNWLLSATGYREPLTIPATARRVISVGAYDSRQNAYADFSGRGSQCPSISENLTSTAPGVDITAPGSGGGYATCHWYFLCGTLSLPDAAALLMEWGIIKGNDPYLYGEKVKAYLRRGAQTPCQGMKNIRMTEVGWGEDVIIRLH